MTVSRIRALPLLLAFLAPAAWAQPVASAWDSDVPPVLTDKDMPPVTDKADKPAAPAVPSMIQGATAPPSQLEPDAATAPTTLTRSQWTPTAMPT